MAAAGPRRRRRSSSSTPRAAPLGQLFHRGLRSAVTWEGAPGRPGPLGAGPAGDLAGTDHLASSLSPSSSETQSNVPLDSTSAKARSGPSCERSTRRCGRPTRSVDRYRARQRARRSADRRRPRPPRLELYDDSGDYGLTADEITARRAAFAAAPSGASAPPRRAQPLDDGVLGFYLDDDYSVFHPDPCRGPRARPHGGPQDGFLDDVPPPAEYGRELSPEPIPRATSRRA